MGKRGLHFILLCCGLILQSCSPESQEFSATKFPPIEPTQTVEPTPFPVASIKGPTTIPYFQVTERPLDPEGPWLWLLISEEAYYSLRNLDGTGLIYLPTLTKTFQDNNMAPNFYSQRKNQILVETKSYFLGEHFLSIINLPKDTVIKLIPLIGTDAQDAIANFKYTPEQELSPILFSLFDESASWSPDGSLIAIAGAMEGPSTDIFVYDFENDQIRQLTNEPDQVSILGWSPDSKYIIYYTTNHIDDYGSHIESYWAVDMEGGSKKLVEINDTVSSSKIAGWLSEDTFITSRISFEFPSEDLKIINIQSGEIQTLYEDHYDNEYFDKKSSRLFINFQRVLGWGPKDYGVFEYDFENKNLLMFLPGKVSITGRLENTPYFFGGEYIDRNYSSHIIDHQGNVIINAITSSYSIPPIASPNGNYIVLQTGNTELSIFNRSGEKIHSLDAIGEICWNDDSQSFYIYKTNSQELIIYYADAKYNWEPIEINRFPNIYFEIIEP